MSDKPNIQYIQFVMPLSLQKQPTVFFITEHLDKPKTMIYSSFVKYLLRHFNINDRSGIIKELDSFQNIFLDNITGEFQIIKDEKERVENENSTSEIQDNSELDKLNEGEE